MNLQDFEKIIYPLHLLDKSQSDFLIKALIGNFNEHNSKVTSLEETLEEAGVIAANLSENLEEKEQAFFIAGFQESVKYFNYVKSYKKEDMNNFAGWYLKNNKQYPDDSLALKEGLYLKDFEKSKQQ